MNCTTVGGWVDALLDGELDPKNAFEVETHLDGCAACKQRYEAKRALSSNMRRLELGYTAPEALRRRIAEGLEAELMASGAAQSAGALVTSVPAERLAAEAPARFEQRATEQPATRARRGPARWFMLAGWPVALAASALLASVLLQQRSQEADEVVAAHVRSLLADHLNDVVSSSHHTVKPWFAGKIDFSPPVPDLSSAGFELVGGRLDYLGHQQVAALVYRKHGHIINVLASLPGHDSPSLPRTDRVQGYSLRSWKQAGLNFVAISDIDPVELANLEHGFANPPATSGEPAGTP
jgi:anti-sigma factor RsiW